MSIVLYPPITQSSLPGFPIGDDLKLYFKPSRANTMADFKAIHVSMSFVDTNRTALPNSYVHRMAFFNINSTTVGQEGEWQYLKLPAALFAHAGRGYRIQIRFSPTTESNVNGSHLTAAQLEAKRFECSEWSIATIAIPIEKPSFEVVGMSTTQSTAIPSMASDFVGRYSGKETLSRYRFQIYETLSGGRENWRLLEDSGDKRIGQYEQQSLVHRSSQVFTSDTGYAVVFSITTKNHYVDEKVYQFTTQGSNVNNVSRIGCTLDEDNGQVMVQVDSHNITASVKALVVRKTSIETNYQKWEHVRTIVNPAANTRFTFPDKFVNEGVVYRYGVQILDADDRLSGMQLESYIIPFYDSPFIIGEQRRQLKLKFDASVQNIRENTREQKVETIGGKYPFIIRNAQVAYREFAISGTISHFMDEDEMFKNSELFIDAEYRDGSGVDSLTRMRMEANNWNRRIHEHNDFALERRFRQEVWDFLKDGKPKIFKSPTLGMVLVQLTQVTLTPTAGIAGLTASFSATATEIGEVNEDNIKRYNLIE